MRILAQCAQRIPHWMWCGCYPQMSFFCGLLSSGKMCWNTTTVCAKCFARWALPSGTCAWGSSKCHSPGVSFHSCDSGPRHILIPQVWTCRNRYHRDIRNHLPQSWLLGSFSVGDLLRCPPLLTLHKAAGSSGWTFWSGWTTAKSHRWANGSEPSSPRTNSHLCSRGPASRCHRWPRTGPDPQLLGESSYWRRVPHCLERLRGHWGRTFQMTRKISSTCCWMLTVDGWRFFWLSVQSSLEWRKQRC